MNVTTMQMPKEKAKEAYREYRAALQLKPTAEYVEIAEAYKSLAQGKAVLDALDAFREAGLDEFARPRLAIARADVQQIRYDCVQAINEPLFDVWPWRSHRGRSAETMFKLPASFYAKGVGYENLHAVVPMIPPRFAPPPSQVRHYWVLWHPEWKQTPRDKDPMLLRRLSRYLFAVVAAWDLTDVEMAVLRRRLA